MFTVFRPKFQYTTYTTPAQRVRSHVLVSFFSFSVYIWSVTAQCMILVVQGVMVFLFVLPPMRRLRVAPASSLPVAPP